MPEVLQLTLANATAVDVTWQVTPKDHPPTEIIQVGYTYGSVEVPPAESYSVCIVGPPQRRCAPKVHNPDALVVCEKEGFRVLEPAS